MRAITFHGKCDVRLSIVPRPVLLSPLDAIVRVTLAGLCGSDLHLYHLREKGLDQGTVMGHEFVGVVHEVGPKVRNLSIGDRVLSPFSVCCGECYFCTHDLPSRCQYAATYGWVSKGVGLQGAQAEFIRVPFATSTLTKIPPDISDEEALLVGDIFATGFFCAENSEISRLRLKYPEDRIVVAVVGCGPVGLMAVVSAIALGATEVYAVDSVGERLALAALFGGIPVDLHKDDPIRRITDATDGRGADAVLEAVGTQKALRLAFQLSRPGATISVVGVQTEESFAGFSPIEGYDKNVTYKNGRCPAKIFSERLFRIIREKKVNITKIISHRVEMNGKEEVRRAYEMFDKKEEGCTKVVFQPVRRERRALL